MVDGRSCGVMLFFFLAILVFFCILVRILNLIARSIVVVFGRVGEFFI